MMKKPFIICCMYTKRLLKKASFIVILLLIPLLVVLMSHAMSGDKGAQTIALYADGEYSQKIQNDILNDKTILRFFPCTSYDTAIDMVKNGKADCAWIFNKNLEENIKSYIDGKLSGSLVEIIEREDNVALKLSREKLYSYIFPYISYNFYHNFTSGMLNGNISDTELYHYYNTENGGDSILKTVMLNNDSITHSDKNYLTAPTRGLLAVVIMLASMAAAMYFLDDRMKGKYAWMPSKKQFLPAFITCFTASALSSIAVFVALAVSGNFTSLKIELPAIIAYIFAASSFGLLLCTLFRSPGKLGAFIPCITIFMLVVCPIFIDFNATRPLQVLFAPTYYINSIFNGKYILMTFIYSALLFSLSGIINFFTSKIEKKGIF